MTGNLKFRILVPVSREQSDWKNVKGRRFQKLASQFLAHQSYSVEEEFRDAGTEIDALCKNKLTGDVIVVEFKARSETVKAESVNKLHTDVQLYDAAQGWIFSISEMGAEARTRLQRLNEKVTGTRFRHFPPGELVNSLIAPGFIKLPTALPSESGQELILCLFEHRTVWVSPLLDPKSGRPYAISGWNALDGEHLSGAHLPDVANTDFPFNDLPWAEGENREFSRSTELQPIVEVIPGDEWSDYRPSRPDDFVGRAHVLNSVSRFLDRVRNNETKSRLFGIKGKSGWGKSSLALKLQDKLKSSDIHLLPVDCRAAVSSFYPDLAIARALTQLSEIVSPGPLFKFEPKFETNPFEESEVVDLLRSVRNRGFLGGVIFDQFEAVIHRKELVSAFDRMRELALASEEAQLPFVIGFSWKTDGSVGADYPGYHLWHSLSDRRKDFEIDRFNREDADEFLALAQRESKVSLSIPIRKFIVENYAGFPWLLKKLTKHYTEAHRHESTAVGATSMLSLEGLFQADLEELSSNEDRCMRFVARSAPIEYGSVSEKFGDGVVSGLVDRRLLINTGGQLNLYWDIFRDYILYNEVPELPNTYVPSLSVRKIRSALNFLLLTQQCSYEELSDQLKIGLTTTDNVVRDLSNFGVVQPNRSDQRLSAVSAEPEDMTKSIVGFLSRHAVYVSARQILDSNAEATLDAITKASSEEYRFISIDEKTLTHYVRRILTYCLHFGLLEKLGNNFHLSDPTTNILDESQRHARVAEVDLFRAPAPPERVIDLIDKILSGELTSFEQAASKGLRNAVFAARTLGIVESDDDTMWVPSEVIKNKPISEVVASAVSNIEPFRSALIGFNSIQLSADDVGSQVADIFGLNWSPGSCKRYGSSYKKWLRWLEG
tara:strand:+ start:1611 stop:4280 length:2670 start_codon:yes stop_codon:yes gene_type:complete